MIEKNILHFLKSLKDNNNKIWFDENKKSYETARGAFIEAVQKMIFLIASFDSDITVLSPKECIFRINRDVRFSKDKRPYKNNMAAYFNRAGKKGTGAGYYVHIEPGKSFAAAGIWMPEAADLAKIRQEIDYNFAEWNKIIGNPAFKKQFNTGIEKTDTLVRPPKGYDENNPAVVFLKLKSFIASRSFTDAEIVSKTIEAELSKTFKAVKPMIDFINKSLD